MDPTVLTALIGSATTIGAIILTRWLDKQRLDKKLLELPRSEEFDKRDQATPSMYDDMKTAERLAFLGISNTRLHTYLNTSLRRGRTLPWRRIFVFFARDDVGYSWEQDKFGSNLLKSVLDIAETFSADTHRDLMSALEQVVFSQSTLPSYYGGSLFQSTINDNARFSSIYVVNYIPTEDADARTSYTIRLSSKNSRGGGTDPFQSYSEGYRAIEAKANAIYALDCSQQNLWDKSAESWDRFEKDFPVYSSVMNDLCDFAGIGGSQTILDVGCGSGRASRPVAKRLNKGRLFLLDRSVRMLTKARSLLKSEWQQYTGIEIHYVLSDAARNIPLYGAAAAARYDRILFHFSFQHLVVNDVSIETLARHWEPFLAQDGEIVIAIHNKCIKCDPPLAFRNWNDEFRNELETNLSAAGLRLKAQVEPSLTIEGLEKGFSQAGLKCIQRKERLYKRTFEDRAAMWLTPAIIGSLAIVEDHGFERVKDAVENAHSRVRQMETMPMTVFFFRFTGGAGFH
jgi:ubiquinone/menaquinone biosynthesis C-methylase UbiE